MTNPLSPADLASAQIPFNTNGQAPQQPQQPALDMQLSPQQIEELQKKQKEMLEARREESRKINPIEFLSQPEHQVTYVGNGYWRQGHRFYVDESTLPVLYTTINRFGLIHISGQALIKTLEPDVIFSESEFQKVFNNVSIVDTDGASEERQDLLTRLAMAMTQLAWESTIHTLNFLPTHVDAHLLLRLEEARIPTELNGKPFSRMVPLFEPTAGRFSGLVGVALIYRSADDTDAEQQQYALLMPELRKKVSDLNFAAVTWLQDVVGLRNAIIEEYMTNDVNNLKARLVNMVGPEILKANEPVAPANDEVASEVDPTDGQLAHDATVGTLSQDEFYEAQESAAQAEADAEAALGETLRDDSPITD
jgi:hypothetical protein